jgi:hypothetical protein
MPSLAYWAERVATAEPKSQPIAIVLFSRDALKDVLKSLTDDDDAERNAKAPAGEKGAEV